MISFGASSSCTPCSPGTHSNDGHTACTPCEAGTALLGGAASCAACTGSGEYSSAAGASVCSIAQPGYEVSDEARTAVEACAVGYFSAGATDACSPCPDGTFQTSTGQSFCSSCGTCVVGSRISSTCLSTSDTICAECEAGKAGDGTGKRLPPQQRRASHESSSVAFALQNIEMASDEGMPLSMPVSGHVLTSSSTFVCCQETVLASGHL